MKRHLEELGNKLRETIDRQQLLDVLLQNDLASFGQFGLVEHGGETGFHGEVTGFVELRVDVGPFTIEPGQAGHREPAEVRHEQGQACMLVVALSTSLSTHTPHSHAVVVSMHVH